MEIILSLLLDCILKKWNQDELTLTSAKAFLSGSTFFLVLVVYGVAFLPSAIVGSRCIGFTVSMVIMFLLANNLYLRMLRRVQEIVGKYKQGMPLPPAIKEEIQVILKVCDIGKGELPIAESGVVFLSGLVGAFISILIQSNQETVGGVGTVFSDGYLICCVALGIYAIIQMVLYPLHKFYIILSAELNFILSTTPSSRTVSAVIDGKDVHSFEFKD